jgi:phthiocerol/phenolphthiocerol synthesis type-I polyketide synthase E
VSKNWDSAVPQDGVADTGLWHDGVAIIGMSARFPGCASVEHYWEKIVAGANLLSSATDDELRAAGIDPSSADATHFVRSGTLLENAESLDARFFDLTRREAEIMDPQQRVFLECAYEALEHAGMTAEAADREDGDSQRIGVFAGIGMNTYLLQLLRNPEAMSSAGSYQLMLGNDKDFLATRVAYKLNLRGPAVAVQTACSTSLAAVHLACQSLIAGECDGALAGGVSVMFPQVAGYPYIPGMILSPDGLCRPFDEKAHGTVPGRGAGVVVLKRLADAVADRDTIYAVIAGSAWNNDGSGKVGYTAPSVDGQMEVIRKAQKVAGVHPDQVGYIEAHGTGTELGDPIEVSALASVFGNRQPGASSCVLGSVKANMGHADVAAGVAGLIKATLAVHHGILPPTPHFERANPSLELERTPFRVSTTACEWPAEDEARWAGVSSFGIGGTNVHLCLRSAPAVADLPEARDPEIGPWIFPLSAKTATALESRVAGLIAFLNLSPESSLSSIAYTLQTGRRAYKYRRSIVASSREELVELLQKPFKDRTVSGDPVQDGTKVAFLFPGQGLQFRGMAAELYATDAQFRELIDAGLALLPEELATAIRPVIESSDDSDKGRELATLPTSVAQPLIFLVEFALAMQWIELGVRPAVLLGHSLGELTAATVAGVFPFEDGMRLAAERGRLMQGTSSGSMLAVSLPVESVTPYLGQDLWIAAENGPKLTVLSGASRAVDEVERRLAADRVATVRLRTDRAFHTPDMAEASTLFAKAVSEVRRDLPKIPWLSNVTGTWISPEEAVSPQYWADQITSRVRFADNAGILVGSKPFLLEVGPGDALATLVRQHDRGLAHASSLGASNRRAGDLGAFLEAASKVWESGTNLNWKGLSAYSPNHSGKIALPTYPFERERYWIEATQPGPELTGAATNSKELSGSGPAPQKRADLSSWFYLPTWQRTPLAEKMLPRRAEPIRQWLVLDDGREYADCLARLLEADQVKVVKLSPTQASRAELETFWQEHPEFASGAPTGLICCWTLTGCSVDLFGVLLALLQTSQRARIRFVQVEFLFDELVDVCGEQVKDAHRAVVAGIATILPTEFPGIAVRIIDVGCLAPALSDASIMAGYVQSVTAEIETVPAYLTTVAFRGPIRWLQVWQPVRIPSPSESVLRPGGTYVITGGIGGIGYSFAKHLLSRYGARVVLVGRTVLPGRERWEEWLTENGPAHPISVRIQRVKELEQSGGELMVLSADVCDQAAMEASWKSIVQRFGQVHGVIHAAGLPGGARIAAQSLESAHEVLRPKVEGSQVLARLLAGRTLDFLAFCSSINTVLPIAGSLAYTAANSFQDFYAVWCRQHLGLPALTINFDAWRDVGMAADASVDPGFELQKSERMRWAMSPAEGIETLEGALAWGEPRVMVSPVDFSSLLEQVMELNLDGHSESEGKFHVGLDREKSQGSACLSDETKAVLDIWQELLGVDVVQAGDNFFELGGHSLLGTMVLARIRERFGIELSIRTIFEASTPDALGERIREARAKALEEPVTIPEDREEFEF